MELRFKLIKVNGQHDLFKGTEAEIRTFCNNHDDLRPQKQLNTIVDYGDHLAMSGILLVFNREVEIGSMDDHSKPCKMRQPGSLGYQPYSWQSTGK